MHDLRNIMSAAIRDDRLTRQTTRRQEAAASRTRIIPDGHPVASPSPPYRCQAETSCSLGTGCMRLGMQLSTTHLSTPCQRDTNKDRLSGPELCDWQV